jgi:Zinc dependent phospholipase C
MRQSRRWSKALLTLGLVIAMAQVSGAYSVLTHEEVVDLLWKDQIRPRLKKRFPSATDDDLRKAHAFAYGGSVLQDMGYYPFGSKYFSDLTHYVRSGDFVVNLIRESSDLNEYAFALGALAHYSSDNCGHPTINRAVSMEFPKLRAKFGEAVTYEDDPKAHIRTEFGFDVTQVAPPTATTTSSVSMWQNRPWSGPSRTLTECRSSKCCPMRTWRSERFGGR